MIKVIPNDIVDYFKYNSLNGEIRNKLNRKPMAKKGELSGSLKGNKYIVIEYKGKKYLAHKIAWFLYYKKQPPEVIDHIDGNGLNNSILNIRESTNKMNNSNKERHRQGKFPCVYKRKNKFSTSYFIRIFENGKYILLGTYKTPEDTYKQLIKIRPEYKA